jgi:hypothetical protein
MLHRLILIVALTGCGNGQGSGELPEEADALIASMLESSDDGFESSEAEDDDGRPETAPEPGGLTIGCLTITTDPAEMPDPPPPSFSVTWEFDECRMWRGGRQSGSHTVGVARNSDNSVRDFTSVRDINRHYALLGTVDIDTTSSLHAEGRRSDGTVSRTLNVQEHRVRTGPGGRVWWDLDVSLDAMHGVDTFDPTTNKLTERLINGSGSIHGRNRDYTVNATLTDILRRPAECCYPVGGTLELVAEGRNGNTAERSFTFTSTCGTATAQDGESLELRACNAE